MNRNDLLPKLQRGMTLVELLVAMTIGIFLTGGIIALFLGTKQSYTLNEQLSRTQESGRFALDVLTREIRQTGYKGTCSGITSLLDTDASGTDRYDLSSPIRGWEGLNITTPTFDIRNLTGYVRNTDAIWIKHAAEDATSPSKNTIYLAQNECKLFQNGSNSTYTTTGVDRLPGNQSGSTVSSTTDMLKFSSRLYYIGTGTSGIGLRERSFDNGHSSVMADEELINGVIDMQITYLRNGAASYVSADNVTDWNAVTAVRINLLVQNNDPNSANVMDQPMSVPFLKNDGTLFVPTDRRYYQVLTTTIALRNWQQQ